MGGSVRANMTRAISTFATAGVWKMDCRGRTDLTTPWPRVQSTDETSTKSPTRTCRFIFFRTDLVTHKSSSFDP